MTASDSTAIVRADQLREGDVVDAVSLRPYLSEDDAVVAEYEYVRVEGSELETAECVRVDFEGIDSYGLPVDHPVLVVRA